MTTLKRAFTADGSISPPPTKKKTVESRSLAVKEDRVEVARSPEPSPIVADFFKPSSQKPPDPCQWRTVEDSLLVCQYDKPDAYAELRPRKIAAFDFDSTLITSKSGKKFTRAADDWQWWHKKVPLTLRRLHNEGYLLAIVSNQAGFKLDPQSQTAKQDRAKVSIFKEKVSAVMRNLDLPISLYAATRHDLYRKPRTGMWDALLKDQGLSTKDLDVGGSIFVGDAAGRIAEGKITKDFSCSDRDLAANIGIRFNTPEEFFLEEAPRTFVRSLEPGKFLADQQKAGTAGVTDYKKKNNVDIVLFVGSPGAGKSSFFWRHLEPQGYERVNQDILKTRDRCLAVAADHLDAGRSVCVDATNADLDVRAHWIKLAKRFGVPIRCVLFTAPTRLCEHNDTVRALGRSWITQSGEAGGISINPEDRTMLPRMAFHSFAKRYMAPTLGEGLQDVTKVDFVFSGDDTARKVWSRYWVSS